MTRFQMLLQCDTLFGEVDMNYEYYYYLSLSRYYFALSPSSYCRPARSHVIRVTDISSMEHNQKFHGRNVLPTEKSGENGYIV